MTLNGWLQIALMLVLVVATARPLGVFMASVLEGRRTFLHPALRPIEGRFYSLAGVDETREQTWLQYASALLMFNAAGFVLLYAILRLQGYPAAQPAGLRRDERAPGLQHGGVVRHQHQLAELRRRDDAVVLQPDGRPHRAELRLGGDRHGRRRAAGARVRPRQGDDRRQLLGRPHARHALRAAAVVDRGRVRAHRVRRAAEPQPIRRRDDARRRQADDRAGPRRQPDRHQAARHQRRRLLQRQLGAPLREPQHLDATSSRCGRSLRSPLASPSPSAA